jgi:uncharacterized YccA/Bax inhibitor family protein
VERTSSNPVLKSAFETSGGYLADQRGIMTFNGVVNKTATLLSVVLLIAGITWYGIANGWISAHLVMPLALGCIVGQIVMTIVLIKNPKRAKSFSLAYAVIEGGVIGAISVMYNARFPGIVFNAMVLTASAVLGMLFLYRTQIIRATENFKLMVGAATMAVGLAYLVAIVLRLFNVPVPLIHEASPMGIAFSVFVLGVAVFNLVLDFDRIEKGVAQQAPVYMEWYCSFGLMVTIMWVYLEMLRLLSKLNRR